MSSSFFLPQPGRDRSTGPGDAHQEPTPARPSPSQSGEDLKPRHPSCWQQAQKLRGPGTRWGRLQKGTRRGLSKAKLLGYTTPDRWVDAHPLATCQIKGDFPIWGTFWAHFHICSLYALSLQRIFCPCCLDGKRRIIKDTSALCP